MKKKFTAKGAKSAKKERGERVLLAFRVRVRNLMIRGDSAPPDQPERMAVAVRS